MCIIAGIDGSTAKTGISIFKDAKYITHALIDLHKIRDVNQRLPEMMEQICDYLLEYPVDKIIIEKSVMKGQNADTLQKLSMISGAVMYYAKIHDIEFENPLPSQWRAVIGMEQSKKVKREILKLEAIKAVKQEYGLDVTDDEAEAILIGRSGFDLPKIEIKAEDVQDEYWGEQE